MKNTIYKISFLLLGFAIVVACESPEGETNYTPADYAFPKTFSIAIDAASLTDTSSELIYTPSAAGKGFYAVTNAGTAAPTSTEVHSGSFSGVLQSGEFDVDGSTPVMSTLDAGLFGSYEYNVHAIHKSTDNFISENVVTTSFTTPDTMDPVFLGDSSDPSFTAAGIDPFAPVTFNFTEPVFYQGGDITFTGFFTGREIIVNDASALSSSGTTITVNTHGTFAEDDFIIIGWAEGTFKDNSGKSVAELGGFDHYFSTRLFLGAEAAFLMQGTYDYSTVFYGGLSGFYAGLFTDFPEFFLPDTGQFELMLDPTDPEGLTLMGINLFSGFGGLGLDEPQTLPIKFGDGGSLVVVDPYTPSVITAGEPTSWGPWGFGGDFFPGFYSVTDGTINHWLTLYGNDSGGAIDDIDYNYLRIGTFERNGLDRLEELKRKSKEAKDAILDGQTRVLPNDVIFSYRN